MMADCIQCDKKKESCGQCVRAHLACPGYQDQSKARFTDQTESVVRKANFRFSIPKLPAPEKLLLPPLEDRAKELFVSKYVLCSTARASCMEHFYVTLPHPAYLVVCIRAVSLAYLSYELRSPEILQRARQTYGSTLRLTNAALQNVQTVKHNATLLTVLLLDMYEKLTQQLVNNITCDTKHLDGALALLQLSGTSQFEDVISLRLFRLISMTILVRCLRRGSDVPLELLELQKLVDSVDKAGKLDDILTRFVALRGEVRRGEKLESEAIAKTKSLDDAVARISLRPPRWTFANGASGDVDYEKLFIDLIEATSMPAGSDSVLSQVAPTRVFT